MATTIDCADPARLAHFWSAVLGYSTVQSGTSTDGTAFVEIGPADWDTARGPAVLFEQVHSLPEKTAKNRVHLDVEAPPGRFRIEVDRVLSLGAAHADIGQHEADLPWTVLTDPEGNEFCILNRDVPTTMRG
ncbi:VOC family protein [Kutzneria sp. NPDC052558]|uniref:VOC family protein n=1 Tax=Kutzneria sp. NPDC052558 TaxID=3364121 RepID=UPI0037C6E4A1